MNKLIATILFCAALGLAACGENAGSDIAVTQIILDTEAFALKLGSARTLTATTLPENASNRRVEWRSDDKNIATIDPATGVVVGRGLGKTTIRAIAAQNGSPQSLCTVTVLATEPYLVGDLYPDATTPQGMVFWIDPADPAKGKIVSLDQTRKAWGYSKAATQALDSDDGRVNMSVIEALEAWQNTYPAFAWCAAKGEGWYLPALNELLTLYDAKELLDEVISQNGDTPFTTGDYWTSTQRRVSPETTALTVVFRYASDNESWASKDGQCVVRAIKTF